MAFGPHQTTLGDGHQASFGEYGSTSSTEKVGSSDENMQTTANQEMNDSDVGKKRESQTESQTDDLEQESEIQSKNELSGKRGVVYTRVSTVRQAKEGDSLQTQAKSLVELAKERDVSLVREPITDEGKSGTDFDRSGIRKVFELASSGRITHLFVNDVSRIGRNAPETLYFVYLLQAEFDVMIEMEKSNVDITDKISDLIQTTLEALMAQVSMEARVTNSIKTTVRKFEQKESWESVRNIVPIGYQKTESESEGDWIDVDQSEKEVAEQMFEFFLQEKSYAATARKIDSEFPEIPKMTEGQIKHRLQQKVYIGVPTMTLETDRTERDKVSVECPDLAIVNTDTFERVQRIIEEKSRGNSRSEETMNPFNFAEKFGLETLFTSCPRLELKCPNCDSTDLAKNGTKPTEDYTVHNYKCNKCSHQSKWPNQNTLKKMRN